MYQPGQRDRIQEEVWLCQNRVPLHRFPADKIGQKYLVYHDSALQRDSVKLGQSLSKELE